jgi:hypothetical protein
MMSKVSTIVLTSLITVTCFAAAPAMDDKLRKYPDVIDVKVRAREQSKFDFDVTISSPYDTPQRYADGFRVRHANGKVYGERKLLHDHAGEQPFTRELYGVTIPPDVRFVVIQARDQKYGYGGKTLKVTLPGR